MKKQILIALLLALTMIFSAGCSLEDVIAESVAREVASSMSETAYTTVPEKTTKRETETSETEDTSETETETETVQEETTVPIQTTADTVTETVPATAQPAVAQEVVTTVQEAAPATQATTVTAIPVIVSSSATPYVFNGAITQSYAYRNYSTDEKEIYDIILNAVKNKQSYVEIPKTRVSTDTIENVVYSIFLYETLYDYIDLGNCYIRTYSDRWQINLAYLYDTATINAIVSRTNSEADRIVSGITPGMSEYDTVNYFHDTIIKKCVYNENAYYRDRAYGALIEGSATCQGYSKAFMLLCNKAGIENTIAVGDARGGHMWSLVRLDGEWYNVDTTWDDNELEGYSDFIYYDYFLVTDAFLARTYEPYNISRPLATGTKYNYFIKNGLYPKNLDEFKGSIYTGAKMAVSANSRYVQVKCADSATFSQAFEFVRNSGVTPILQQVSKETGKNISCDTYEFFTIEEDQWILILLQY